MRIYIYIYYFIWIDVSFSVYPSSHEYTTRLLKRENHDTQKHTQGTTSQNGHPKSHYATDAHVQKYKHYSSKEEEMIAIRVDSQNSAAAHLLKSMAPQRSVRTEIDSYYGNIDTKYTNTDRRTFNTTHRNNFQMKRL